MKNYVEITQDTEGPFKDWLVTIKKPNGNKLTIALSTEKEANAAAAVLRDAVYIELRTVSEVIL